MLPFIAIPILHSSGAWIISTAASGYIAGTLSSTWIGAFVAGNAGLLSSFGITSAAGVYAALGGKFSVASTALGGGVSSIGLSGLAHSLGYVPVTFLGLTYVSWAIVASSLLIISSSGLLYLVARKKLQLINNERRKGNLADTTWREILEDARNFEIQAMFELLGKLGEESKDIIVDEASESVYIRGVKYRIGDLKYIVEKNGVERIVKSSFIPFQRIVIYTVIKL